MILVTYTRLARNYIISMWNAKIQAIIYSAMSVTFSNLDMTKADVRSLLPQGGKGYGEGGQGFQYTHIELLKLKLETVSRSSHRLFGPC